VVFVAQCDRENPRRLPHDFAFPASRSVNNANMFTFYCRPMKKKGGGTLAGIPRASGERNSPVGNGASSNVQVSSYSPLHHPVELCIHVFVTFTPFAILFRWNLDGIDRSSIRFHLPGDDLRRANARAAISSFRIYRTIKTPPHPHETRHTFPNLKLKC
jgi:hypothetical protein